MSPQHQSLLLILTVLVAALPVAGQVNSAIPAEPVRIGHQPQLFVDDYLVNNRWAVKISREEVVHRFHAPVKHPANPVIAGQGGYVSAHYDPQKNKFRLWYQVWNPKALKDKSLAKYAIAYAESTDGIHWTLPIFNRIRFNGTTENNVCFAGLKDRLASGGWILDVPPRFRNGYRFVMLYTGHGGMHLIGSNDGIHWDADSDRIIKSYHSDTCNNIVYDAPRERFLLFCRPRMIYRGWVDRPDIGAMRRVARMTSPTLWEPWEQNPVNLITPDRLDSDQQFDHFYGMVVKSHGDLLLGSIWPFKMNTDIVTELTFSRDGGRFCRLPTRPRLIDLGPDGSWDDGMVFGTTWVEVGDQWWLYYAGWDGPHKTRQRSVGIGLATIRKEGFVSLHGPANGGGFVSTRVLSWPGGDLHINATTADSGSLAVRVVTPQRDFIDGFDYTDGGNLAGDATAGLIRWGQRSLDELAGQDIRLEFFLQDADLYGFRAAKKGDPPSGQFTRLDDATVPGHELLKKTTLEKVREATRKNVAKHTADRQAADVGPPASEASLAPIPTQPIEIGDEPQLFVDDWIVDNRWAMKFPKLSVLRRHHAPQKHPSNPLMSGSVTYPTVVRDESAGLFRMYYQIYDPDWRKSEGPKYALAYAESTDGLAWTRPAIDKYEWLGSKENNVIWTAGKGGRVIDLPDKYRRGYKYVLLTSHGDGLHLIGTKDGVTFDESDSVRIKYLHSDTLNNVVYDPARDRFLLYCRPRLYYRGWVDRRDIGATRRMAYMVSNDLWTRWADDPTSILIPDRLDMQNDFNFFYGMPVQHYGGVFFGFLWPFKLNTDIVTELAFSRDGAVYDRLPERPRLIDLGPDGSWDDGMVFATGFVEVDRQWWVYYLGFDGPHGSRDRTGGVGLATIRKEGFISMYGPANRGGFICTRQIVWPGGDLVINAATEPGGVLKVRALTPMRETIEGFDYQDCGALAGDSTDHVVTFAGRSMDQLKGQTLRLEFFLDGADLWAFRADRNPPEAPQLKPADDPAAAKPPQEKLKQTGDPTETPVAEQQAQVEASKVAPPPAAAEVRGETVFDMTFDNDPPREAVRDQLAQVGRKKAPQTLPKQVDGPDGGQAMQFDGVDDALRINLDPTYAPPTGTIQLAFKPSAPLSAGRENPDVLLSLYMHSGNRLDLRIDENSGQLTCLILEKGGEPVKIASTQNHWPANQWQRVRVDFSPARQVLWVNGEQVDQTAPGSGLGHIRKGFVYVGCLPAHFTKRQYTFTGTIDDIRITARKETE